MGYQITEGEGTYDIEPTDFVKVEVLEDGFYSHGEIGELYKKGKVTNFSGAIFANGKPSWVKILGVFGGKVKEEVVIDEKSKKAPTKTKKAD